MRLIVEPALECDVGPVDVPDPFGDRVRQIRTRGGHWKRDYGDSYTGTKGETLDTAKELLTDYRASSDPTNPYRYSAKKP
jgi:hypothetical protein